MQKRSGFTLMDLVVVIVVLGILAVVAVPKYIELSGKAGKADANGVAGAISSGSAINLAAAKAGAGVGCVVTDGQDCNTLAGLLLAGGALPDGYSTSGSPTFSAAGIGTCVIQEDHGGSANATIHQVTSCPK